MAAIMYSSWGRRCSNSLMNWGWDATDELRFQVDETTMILRVSACKALRNSCLWWMERNKESKTGSPIVIRSRWEEYSALSSSETRHIVRECLDMEAVDMSLCALLTPCNERLLVAPGPWEIRRRGISSSGKSSIELAIIPRSKDVALACCHGIKGRCFWWIRNSRSLPNEERLSGTVKKVWMRMSLKRCWASSTERSRVVGLRTIIKTVFWYGKVAAFLPGTSSGLLRQKRLGGGYSFAVPLVNYSCFHDISFQSLLYRFGVVITTEFSRTFLIWKTWLVSYVQFSVANNKNHDWKAEYTTMPDNIIQID